MEERVISLPNEVFLPAVIAMISEHPGKVGIIPLRGRSMRPFLEDGRDKAMLQIPERPYRKYDAVLAEIEPGLFVLHRIIDIDDNQRVTLRGDGNLSNEYCTLTDIRALAIAFIRKGRKKADSTEGRKWKVYSWLWTRLFPLRRYLLFILHPHVPQCLKRRQQNKN